MNVPGSVVGWALTLDWLPCPAVTAASCARPALHSSHPSHKATVLGPPGLEWGLQEWSSALPLLFLSLTKGQKAPSTCGERVWRAKREAGEAEGGSRGLGRRQRWETSFWHLVEPGCCLEGQPSGRNRESCNSAQRPEDRDNWNSEPSTPEGIQPDAHLPITCILLWPIEKSAEVGGGGEGCTGTGPASEKILTATPLGLRGR